jgi:hypothetical protein
MLTGEPYHLIKLSLTFNQRRQIAGNVYTAVSFDDVAWMKEFKWYLNIPGSKWMYAYTRYREGSRWVNMGMQRMILARANPARMSSERRADHRNGYTLDNRRSNLRSLSVSDNRLNVYPYSEIDIEPPPYEPPYAPSTGPLLPFGVRYRYHPLYKVWRPIGNASQLV